MAHIIEVVYSNGEGHEIRIKMPSSVKGSNYLVKVNQSGVLVMVGEDVVIPFLTGKESTVILPIKPRFSCFLKKLHNSKYEG